MATMADLLATYKSDVSAEAGDNSTIAAAQAQLASAQAQAATDLTKEGADASTLAQAIDTNGPFVDVNPNGLSADLYTASPDGTTFVVTSYPTAASVQLAAAAPSS